jgi:hypothetical protein
MNRPVRGLNGFYEVDSQYAVPGARAEMIINAAATIVGRYTGPIVVANVQGARIKTPDNPLSLHKVKIGQAPHTALITRRGTMLEDGRPIVAATRRQGYGVNFNTRTLVQDAGIEADFMGERAVSRQAHEFGHTFRLKHCVGQLCCMNDTAPVMAIETGRPFCDPHAKELDLAGRLALATRL